MENRGCGIVDSCTMMNLHGGCEIIYESSYLENIGERELNRNREVMNIVRVIVEKNCLEEWGIVVEKSSIVVKKMNDRELSIIVG